MLDRREGREVVGMGLESGGVNVSSSDWPPPVVSSDIGRRGGGCSERPLGLNKANHGVVFPEGAKFDDGLHDLPAEADSLPFLSEAG